MGYGCGAGNRRRAFILPDKESRAVRADTRVPGTSGPNAVSRRSPAAGIRPGKRAVRARAVVGDRTSDGALRGTARGIAHAMLVDVLRDGRSLGAAGRRRPDSNLDPRDRAFARELAFGTLRHLLRLDAWLAHVARRPPRRRDTDVRVLALLGIYQLAFTRVPPHAAVSATVALAGALGKPWAAGFLNAALRRFAAERDAIERIELAPSARLAHPVWLLEAFERSWPGLGESIARANLERPPMTLRVNTLRTSRRRYLDRLSRDGIRSRATRHSDAGVVLESPQAVESVPGFAEGLVSVQDEAAQLAAALLDAPRGSRVLDACAAPGGKTAHLREMQPALGSITALDADEKRLGRLRDALDRLGLAAAIVHADACAPDSWWDRRPFDRILLDAPCSAAGVIRRHPDIKRLKSPQQLAALQDLQAKLLQANWPLLQRGGTLLYSTCSLLRAENDRVVERFLDQTPDAELETIRAGWGVATSCGRQLLSCRDDTDGFYYATLRKA